jgi:hypothetical protein
LHQQHSGSSSNFDESEILLVLLAKFSACEFGSTTTRPPLSHYAEGLVDPNFDLHKTLLFYYALQITFRLSPVQIVNFLCPIDEISVIRASIEHKKLTI